MKEMKNSFWILLFIIIFFGLLLRLHHYDSIPGWREVDDEIHYSWAGWSWLHFGIPESWSWLSSYPSIEMRTVWGDQWRMVTPMLEKPPLYILLNGILTYHLNDWSEHRLSLIRLLPISLSIATIFLVGILGTLMGNKTLGLLSALLYATVPFVVLANRISVTENLLTPLALLLLVFLLSFMRKRESLDPRVHKSLSQTGFGNDKRELKNLAVLSGMIAGLGILTKQSGVILLVPILVFFGKKHWKLAVVSIATALLIGSIYPLVGFWFDGKLFLQLMSEARRIGIQGGLPELLYTILGRPLIATERLFPDGMMLLGYLLLFTAPLWWLKKNSSLSSRPIRRSRSVEGSYLQSSDEIDSSTQFILSKVEGLGMTNSFYKSRLLFLSLPLSYVGYLFLTTTGAETIGSGQAFWGWYLYPLFPFMTILVAEFFLKLWQNYSLTQTFLVLGTVGAESIHQFLQFTPRTMHYRWQQLLIVLTALLIATHFLPKKQKQWVLGSLGMVVIVINAGVVWFLPNIYSPVPQT